MPTDSTVGDQIGSCIDDVIIITKRVFFCRSKRCPIRRRPNCFSSGLRQAAPANGEALAISAPLERTAYSSIPRSECGTGYSWPTFHEEL
jgi:hypothetical protein